MSVRLTCIWFVGVIFRWFFLMPWRVSVTFIGCIWMIISMTIGKLIFLDNFQFRWLKNSVIKIGNKAFIPLMLNLLKWNAFFRITLSMHYVHFDDKSFGDNFLSTKFHLPDANWLLETRLTSDSSSSTFPSWSPSIDFSTSFVDFIRFKVDSTQGLVHGYNELRWSMKDDRLS